MSPVGLAVCFLLAAFLGAGKFRLGQILRYYALQSFFLALILVSLGITGDWRLFVNAAGVLIFKVLIIPSIIHTNAKWSQASGRLTSLIRPAPTYFVSGLTLLLGVLVGVEIAPALGQTDLILTITAFTAMFLGCSMMALRRDLYSQMIGFFTLENGIALFMVVTLYTLPLLAEMGIFITAMLAAALMSTLSRRLKELYAVEDTHAWPELID